MNRARAARSTASPANEKALDRAQQREGVESTELEALSTRVESLTGDVAALRIREAVARRDRCEGNWSRSTRAAKSTS